MVDLFLRAAPLLWQGLLTTLVLGVVGYVLALILGAATALARLYGPKPLRWLAVAYVSVFTGTPLLTQILLIYYGLPQFGIVLPAVPSVILALTLHVGAYISEDWRGTIGAVDRGQWEASATIGMTPTRAFRRIIVPQVLYMATPSLGMRFVSMIKETSLASVVTVTELTRVGESVGSSTFRYLEMFVIVGAIYWIVCTILQAGQTVLEGRLRRAYL